MYGELEIIEGFNVGKLFELKGHTTFLVGREKICDLVIEDDEYISRHHFIIEANPPEFKIKDLKSKNGTFINGKRINKNEVLDLKEEDIIRAGKTKFCFKIIKEGECRRCGKKIEQSKEFCSDCESKIKLKERKCCLCATNIKTGEENLVDGENFICPNCNEVRKEKKIDELLREIKKENLFFKDYKIIKKLGEGGNGVVYLVEKGGKRYALKTLIPTKEKYSYKEIECFKREMEICKQLIHPNIVEFYESGYENGQFYFVMEYCNGGDLTDLMVEKGGKLNYKDLMPIMIKILEGLNYAHKNKIIHRDLKTENILIIKKENEIIPKISDFGLAKNFNKAGFSGITITGSYGGTLPYMPPEQILNFKYEKETSDIFSIGATFYYALTGKYVYDFTKEDPIDTILKGKIIFLKERKIDIPEKLKEILDKAIQPKVEERFQNVEEMIMELKKIKDMSL